MKSLKNESNLSMWWIIGLALLGVIQKLLQIAGILILGTWLNFFVTLLIPLIWGMVIVQKTSRPFGPLVWVGGFSGALSAGIEVIYWLNTHEKPISSFYKLESG